MSDELAHELVYMALNCYYNAPYAEKQIAAKLAAYRVSVVEEAARHWPVWGEVKLQAGGTAYRCNCGAIVEDWQQHIRSLVTGGKS